MYIFVHDIYTISLIFCILINQVFAYFLYYFTYILHIYHAFEYLYYFMDILHIYQFFAFLHYFMEIVYNNNSNNNICLKSNVYKHTSSVDCTQNELYNLKQYDHYK